MTRPLFDELTTIRKRVAGAAHLLLGLDYDGTLTPIVDDPSNAKLGSETRELLRSLAARPDTSVAIISGRALEDVRRLVGIDSLIYAGNHGLDISGPGLRFVEPTAVKEQRSLGWLAAVLATGLVHIAGAVVENKALTLSVHFRRVAPREVDEVRRHVESAVAVAPHRFHTSLGNHVFEVRPQVDWNKGTAMSWIRHRLGKPNSLTFYLGDDQTDEDAFLALCDGITVKVGQPSETLANYHLEGPAGVKRFLLWLDSVGAERR